MPKLTTQFKAAQDSPGFLLWQASSLWQRSIREALAPTGLTHAQFVLLASLAWLGGSDTGINQVQLAEHARMDVMMTSDVLRTLEAKGLIRRVRNPLDRRAWNLEIQEAGLALANQAVGLVEKADSAFFGRLKSNAPLLELLQILATPD